MYRLVWGRRWLFGVSFLMPFLICAVVIRSSPPAHPIRSSVMLALMYTDSGKLESLEPPEVVAKRVVERYLPEAMIALGAQGLVSAKVARIGGLKAVPLGNEVILSDIVRGDSDSDFKSVQRAVIDHIIKDSTALVKAWSDSVRVRIASAKRSAEGYERRIKVTNDQIANLEERGASRRRTLQQLQDALAKLNAKSEGQSVEPSLTNEIQIALVTQKIADMEQLRREDDEAMARLAIASTDLYQLKEEEWRAMDIGENQLKQSRDAEVILPPSLIPIPVGTRSLFLLMSALAGSLLFAVFMVFAAERVGSRQAE